MDWQTMMAGLESWLWSAPYLDVPNYAWIASGLGLLVAVLYLILVFTAPPEEMEEEAAAASETKARGPAEDEETAGEAAAKPEKAPPPPEPRLEEEEKERTVPEPPPPEEPMVPEPSAKAEATERPAPETCTPEPEPEEAVPPEPVPVPAPTAEAAPLEEEEEVEEEEEEIELVPPEGWISRLRSGLSKTQEKFTKRLSSILSGAKVDEDTMEELEEVLMTSDLGVKTCMKLLEKMEEEVERGAMENGDRLREWLRDEIEGILKKVEAPLTVPDDIEGPFVIMVTGVNGTGKTTTIGKLAMRFKKEGKSVLIGAADTFRAAAIEQLEIWAKRSGAHIIKHQEGADPAAVAYDAVHAAQARGTDVVIIDTAGRLHTKVNLMEELKKVKRITAREAPGAPHETILVLDATTGQNALQQAKSFNEALEINGLIMTKLDGTAKGGIIVAVSDEFNIPIRFIGVGEKIYDLQPFKADEFVSALF